MHWPGSAASQQLLPPVHEELPSPRPACAPFPALQSSDGNKKKLAAMNGIDALLQAIAPYRNRWVEAEPLCSVVLSRSVLGCCQPGGLPPRPSTLSPPASSLL